MSVIDTDDQDLAMSSNDEEVSENDERS